MILSLFGSPCSTEKDKERGGGGAFKKFCRFRPSPPSRLSGSRKATEEDVSLKVMPPPPLKWGTAGNCKKKKLAILSRASSVNARHLFRELDIILLLGSRVLSSSAAVASATEKKVCRVTERRKEEWKDNGTLEVLVVVRLCLFPWFPPSLQLYSRLHKAIKNISGIGFGGFFCVVTLLTMRGCIHSSVSRN